MARTKAGENAIASVVGKLVEQYVQSSQNGDCRLLVPGITQTIARELHDYLQSRNIKSYLVVGPSLKPSETDSYITAIGLTSRRIGSFIAIATPGQLVHIQDSIRGSGGTIRSVAFSEEWPWIDDGSEHFQFKGPVLNALVQDWSNDPDEQEWFRKLVLDVLLQETLPSSRRSHVFLEDILGSFSPDLYPEISSVRKKFLCHAGVPCPSGILPDVKQLNKETTRLCRGIVERCRKEEDVRTDVKDRVDEVVEETERDETKVLLDQFLDAMGGSTTLDLGMLAFYRCWGPDRTDTRHWRKLDSKLLGELFGVSGNDKAKVSCEKVKCQRGIIADERNKLATFVNEQVGIDTSYSIPESSFVAGEWSVQVLNWSRVITRRSIVEREGNIHLEFNTTESTNNYSRRVPIRIALVNGETVEAYARLNMHLCGEHRPTFVVVESTFDVVDARPENEDGVPEEKIELDEPVHLFLFSYEERDVALRDENDDEFPIEEVEEMRGIWKSNQRMDISAEPSGFSIRVCKFGMSKAVLHFEAGDMHKGEFTLEDELRVTISRGPEKQLKHLVELFQGKKNEPYPGLGKINNAARRRILLDKYATSSDGWKPILANLLATDFQSPCPLGSFVCSLGPVTESAFGSLELPADVSPLLEQYSITRDKVLREVKSLFPPDKIRIEHPTYASHPVFVHERIGKMDTLLKNYLDAFGCILEYLKDKKNDLEWSQLFVLTHVDCVVHWDESPLKNAFLLIGPWHPLVLAKRFMVQGALFSRAYRLLHENDGKIFRGLSVLLGSVQGFRWIPGISREERIIEPTYVKLTSDPGWHLALRIKGGVEKSKSFTEIAQGLFHSLGLQVGTGIGENILVNTCLSSYLRAFPSRRSIGIRIRRGYAGNDIVRTVDSYMHEEEGATEKGKQLPGGIRLYFEENPIDDEIDVRWTDPPFYIYQFKDDSECLPEAHPDIYMLPPANDLSFKSESAQHEIPRGNSQEAVFSNRLNWLIEGQTLIPKSVAYEYDCPRVNCGDESMGEAFINVTGQASTLLGNPVATVCEVDLPREKLHAPWVVIPGHSIDPAVLVKYVRDGSDRKIEERALWDYKLDITGRENSYFVLSTIPRSFQVAVNGFFNRENIAGDFVVELGEIGISIGGEALRSGRHALGIIGLIGAVRLLVDKTSNGQSPVSCSPSTVGFLVPVDSFSSFFGKSGSGQGKRSDLLAVQLVLPMCEPEKLRISACGVESKLVSGTFSNTRALDALEQARETSDEFRKLVLTSLDRGGMPERLALLNMLKFGLRISSPSKPEEIREWVSKERTVYKAILAGNYEYVGAHHEGLLVSTEGALPGAAEYNALGKGVWVRLTKEHWPGISETPRVSSIREALCRLFGIHADFSPSPTPAPPDNKEVSKTWEVSSSTTKPSPDPSPDDTSPEEIQATEEPNRQETEIPLERILIGVDNARVKTYFDPQSKVNPLDNMNVMVTGSSGTGKTQFLKYLICQLREQGKNVLVLDMKNDFASDKTFCKNAELERVFVAFDGLPINPLIPYPVPHPETGEFFVQCGQYMAGISSILKQTYGLGAQQQAAVKNAIADAFTMAGIPTAGSMPFNDDTLFPDFSDVGNVLQQSNIAAYNRLDPLFTLGLFPRTSQSKSFHGLANRAVVVDLSQITSDEIKNTLAQLIVLSSHAYYNSQPHSGAIRQFLVFDEGHRVLTSNYMLRLVRECRAYGIGTILSSQYPSDFPGDISASMATKIIHGNGRDTDKVKSIVQLLGCEGKETEIAAMERFTAFVDNMHYPHTILRTINYPLYLAWKKLKESGKATHNELSQSNGVDTSRLPIGNIVRQLERLGLAEEREGHVFLLEQA